MFCWIKCSDKQNYFVFQPTVRIHRRPSIVSDIFIVSPQIHSFHIRKACRFYQRIEFINIFCRAQQPFSQRPNPSPSIHRFRPLAPKTSICSIRCNGVCQNFRSSKSYLVCNKRPLTTELG